MTSTCIFMAMTEDPLLLFFRDTLPYDLICTILEKERLLPIIGMDLSKEMPLSWALHSLGTSPVTKKFAM